VLLGVRIGLVADSANLRTHSAQTAFVTAAILFARAGATVFLCAPNVILSGPQPPLRRARMIDALVEIDGQIIPKKSFITTRQAEALELAITLGDSKYEGAADLRLSINANDWSAWLSDVKVATRWRGRRWPLGGLASAALASTEGYKVAMRKLRNWRRNDIFDEFFAPTRSAYIQLAPNSTPTITSLGNLDFISGGAITHATLFALGRVLGCRGNVRVIDREEYDLSNANRYMLLRLDRRYLSKAVDLMSQDIGQLNVTGVVSRYEPLTRAEIGPLASAVLVGVDHIPTRWLAQDAEPDWLGIGATSHYYTMFTAHQRHLPCAKCGHPYDDPGTELIPTAGFVSFWAGLFLAARYLRHLSQSREHFAEQQIGFCPLRSEGSVQVTRVHRVSSCVRCATRTAERGVSVEALAR
jgi:hypothetical protein